MTGEAGRIGSGEGEAPGREAFQLGSSSEALGLVALVETAQCNSFSLLFTELARAQVHAHMVRKSPTETKFLLTLRASLGHFFKKLFS